MNIIRAIVQAEVKCLSLRKKKKQHTQPQSEFLFQCYTALTMEGRQGIQTYL